VAYESLRDHPLHVADEHRKSFGHWQTQA
jgi:hypothetical protein